MFLLEWSYDGGHTMDCALCESQTVLDCYLFALGLTGANVVVICPV